MESRGDLARVAKPSTALRLVLEATSLILHADDTLSVFQTLEMLLHAREEIVNNLHSFDTTTISCNVHDKFASILHDDRYDAAAAIAEGGNLIQNVVFALDAIEKRLIQEHGNQLRTFPYTSFCICVDGSRVGRLACEVGLALRRHGSLHVCYIDEFSSEARFSSDFIVKDYTMLCKRHGMHESKLSIRTQAQRLTHSTISSQILELRGDCNADFIVLGSIGTKGPQAPQLGSNTVRAIHDSTISIIIVPPVPASLPTSGQRVFVVAMDNSSMGKICYTAALKLLKPSDRLHILHIKLPVLPLELESSDHFDTTVAPFYTKRMEQGEIKGLVEIIPNERGNTVAEDIQEYIAKVHAAFLVFGIVGDGALEKVPKTTRSVQLNLRHASHRGSSGNLNSAGHVATRLLDTPHCNLVLCNLG